MPNSQHKFHLNGRRDHRLIKSILMGKLEAMGIENPASYITVSTVNEKRHEIAIKHPLLSITMSMEQAEYFIHGIDAAGIKVNRPPLVIPNGSIINKSTSFEYSNTGLSLRQDSNQSLGYVEAQSYRLGTSPTHHIGMKSALTGYDTSLNDDVRKDAPDPF